MLAAQTRHSGPDCVSMSRKTRDNFVCLHNLTSLHVCYVLSGLLVLMLALCGS
jgi:hypothetical protein